MERHRFGIGSYKYWDYPLPDLVQILREEIYPRLVLNMEMGSKKITICNCTY